MRAHTSRAARCRPGRWLAAALPLVFAFGAGNAEATFRYGPIQISGNIESQTQFRLDQSTTQTFQAFDPVMQRNTFRLQYEHELVERGTFLDSMEIPFVKSASFFAYYRGVYDSIYDIAPGPFQRANDGSRDRSIGSIRDSIRDDVAFENVLREVYLDLDLEDLPLSFRIGRQQVNWGNTLSFRALDSVNPLDLTWHFQQEAGILGRVGFSELRRPTWMAKVLLSLGSVGPLANVYVEAWDNPFDFVPTKVRFLPFPWGYPVRNPFRGGQTLDLGAAAGGPESGLLVQPCFDFTGFSGGNAQANPDFSNTSETGACNAADRQVSRLEQGLYDRRDPFDVNQFGARLGGMTRFGLGFTLNYMHRRHIADATGGTVAKAQVGAVNANAQDFVAISPHTTTDPATGETNDTLGFLRIPIEFYYPYVHVFGLSLDYFDEFTSAVWNFEAAATKGVPIATLDPTGNGLRRTWEIEAGLLIDRPTWIRFLNPRSTWTVLFQTNVAVVPDHEDIQMDAAGNLVDGDVGTPNSNLIPGQFRDNDTIDRRKQFEPLSLLAASSFYKGGSMVPIVAVVWNWAYMPSGEIQAFFQYLPTNNVILEPGIRFFWSDGKTVDDRFGVGIHSGRTEAQFKATYQF